MNAIATEQNSPRALTLAAAKSSLYRVAEITQTIQISLLILNALVWPPLLFCKPELKVWSVLSALLIPLLEVTIFEVLQGRWKTCAAKIQEVFDCDLFQLGWNDFKIEGRPREEDIASWADRFQKSGGDENSLRNWYPFTFPDLPVEHARLICQRANAWWDTELRALYSYTIVIVIVMFFAIALVIGIAAGLTLETFIVAVLAPIIPISVWGVKEVKKLFAIVKAGNRIVKQLERLWAKVCSRTVTPSELTLESRALQNEIFDRRKGSTVNPQWLYRKKRADFQRRMVTAADALLEQYRPNGNP